MVKKLGFAFVLMLVMVRLSGAQEDFAQLRVMQMSFIPELSATVDIQVDDTVVFESISFPFVTDYIQLAPGQHTLKTIIVDHEKATASTILSVEAGRSYTVIAEGDYTDHVSFTIIDEAGLPLEVANSAAIVVNLTADPIRDIYLDDMLVIESVPAGAYDFIGLPLTDFTLTGHLGDETYSESFTPLSNATLLGVVNRNLNVIFHRSSNLTIASYLQSIDAGAHFAPIAEALRTTNLLDAVTDGGTFTLFLPTNEVLDSFAELPVDADQLHELLSSHIVAQNLPPYVLPNHETLTTLTGKPVALQFSETDSGYWEIEGAPILWDIRLANGVIYAIDGVINPLQ
ncbi:MAG: fasciclin domain-containing protein [Anaerolineae bacterium]|nr:fasciclin domain-containing protein [Anaerolineae bacterium]